MFNALLYTFSVLLKVSPSLEHCAKYLARYVSSETFARAFVRDIRFQLLLLYIYNI